MLGHEPKHHNQLLHFSSSAVNTKSMRPTAMYPSEPSVTFIVEQVQSDRLELGSMSKEESLRAVPKVLG